MSRPDPNDINELLDRCLMKLQAGQDLETVLAAYPDQQETLRPVLESVMAVWAARGSDTVPVAAMTRSRNKLMKAVYDLKQAPPLPWWRRQPVFLRGAIVPIAVGLVCFSLLFTGIASAQSLPGQVLYPFKLAAEQIVLSLPASPSAQLAREQKYDLRRKDEVETLISKQREQEVDMTGFLMKTADGSGWLLDASPLVIPAAMQESLAVLEGHFVAVHADLMAGGQIDVKSIESRVYLVAGKIQALEAARLQVGDIWFGIGPETQIGGVLNLGTQVEINVTRLSDESYFALRVTAAGSSSAVEPTQPKRKNTVTVEPVESIATEVEIQPQDTSEAPALPKATAAEPTEKPESSSTPVQRRTPQASRTPRPENTQEPTQPPDNNNNNNNNHHPDPTATPAHSENGGSHATRTPEHQDQGPAQHTPDPTQKSND